MGFELTTYKSEGEGGNHYTMDKFFTYVTKTRPNLTTYSRKPGNFNGTISFEIDIMKNSSPINLNLCQT